MDILSVKSGVIVHQVNCQGIMGAGIALKIKRKWPLVFQRYRKFKFKLGQIQLIQVEPGLWICNLAGQDRYGRDKRYTDYEAVRIGLDKLNAWVWAEEKDLRHGIPIYIPKFMSSANAGGDWDIISKLISEVLADRKIIICDTAGGEERF